MNKKGLIGSLIGAFIVLIIGISLLPMVSEQIANITVDNITFGDTNGIEESWGRTLLAIVPLFFVLAILTVVIGVVYSSLRNAGLVGGGYDSRDLNEDGGVDDNEEMLGELEEGQKALPGTRYKEADTEVEQLTEAEEDLENYKRRNKKYHETIEKDIKKETLYDEEETRVDQLSETKKGLESHRGKIKRFKDRMSKFKGKKTVSEEDLKESKFD